jgi:NAD(P)-dependent dehydrogenase (short-subunit alcohol dehydrogenase family)
MHIDLTGRRAVITGASQGLGAGMAATLSAAGAELCLVARNRDKLESVRSTLDRAQVFACDVTVEEDVARAAAAIGPADILINCAGTNLRKDIGDFTLEEFEGVVAASLRGTFLMSRALVPVLKARGAGRILNIASMFAHVSLPRRTAYSAAKASLLGFTKALALELAPDAVTVNSISPGPVATDINLAVRNDPAANKLFTDNIPLGRWGRVEEVAALACFLCSDQAAFITGSDILIDGGWTAK